MKVIFLDMDGVLNRGWTTERQHYIEKDLVLNLKKVINETGAKVVLSTSWREFPDWERFLKEFFACFDIEVIGSTPILDDKREREIRSWLKSHEGEVEQFVVLDDFDMTDEFGSNMVATVGYNVMGLDDVFTKKAIDVLNSTQHDHFERERT